VKASRFIFIFIFLSGMIFSIFQYIPFLQDETIGPNNELAKKTCEDDTSGDDGDETKTEGDAINEFFNINFNAIYSVTHPFPSNKDDYNSFFQKINIPPPKA
jgi:hypothetical protein